MYIEHRLMDQLIDHVAWRCMQNHSDFDFNIFPSNGRMLDLLVMPENNSQYGDRNVSWHRVFCLGILRILLNFNNSVHI
jgi:hypothetical protein